MSRTPEEMARLYADEECTGNAIYGDGLYAGFLAGYKAAVPQWVKLQEVIPEMDQEVLVRDMEGETYLATVTKSGVQIKSNGCSRCDEPVDVVLWRRLSEQSKEGK